MLVHTMESGRTFQHAGLESVTVGQVIDRSIVALPMCDGKPWKQSQASHSVTSAFQKPDQAAGQGSKHQ